MASLPFIAVAARAFGPDTGEQIPVIITVVQRPMAVSTRYSLHGSAECAGPLTLPAEMRILIDRTIPARRDAGFGGTHGKRQLLRFSAEPFPIVETPQGLVSSTFSGASAAAHHCPGDTWSPTSKLPGRAPVAGKLRESVYGESAREYAPGLPASPGPAGQRGR